MMKINLKRRKEAKKVEESIREKQVGSLGS